MADNFKLPDPTKLTENMEVRHVLTLPETGPEFNRWSAFNPSICEAGDGSGYGMTMRSSNYVFGEPRPKVHITIGDYVETRVWFGRLREDMWGLESYGRVDVQADPPLKRGAEDPRLYWLNGGWEFMATILDQPHAPEGIGRMARFTMDEQSMTAQIQEVYKSRKTLMVEKNWSKTSDGTGNFDFIYGPNIVVRGRKFEQIGPKEVVPKLRGGTQLLALGDGTYIACGHMTHDKRTDTPVFDQRRLSVHYPTTRHYTHMFVRYNENGRIIAVSDEFRFQDLPIEYASGIVRHEDKFVVSFGVEDKSTWLAHIPVNDVMENLRDVT